ncbi:MAG: hypothetical protein NZM12_10345 [Steroidobacteraceae bacterium]|nr:hypothetical protein [Steroidobacteraceae bacterium]MDW8259330.1 hypothetical protein [Gammaproteobacteria bacterium]
MKLYGTDNQIVMTVTSLERDGGQLLIKGKVFGAMPISAKLRPEELRAGLKLLGWRNLLFLSAMLFRRTGSG